MNTPVSVLIDWDAPKHRGILALGAKVAGEPTGWQILENGGMRIHSRHARGTGYTDFHHDHVRDAMAALAAEGGAP